MCPVKSMGLSNLKRMSELVDGVDELFQVDTITDGVESESLTWEPGRKATVLAHNDFAVDGPGVQLISRGWDKVLDHQ